MEKLEKKTNPLRYAVGMFGTSIPINMFKTYAAYFYVDSLGLITTPQFSLILFIYTFLDAIDNPIYGFLSDRTRTQKWGRRKPWLIIAAPLLVLSFILFFNPPSFLSPESSFSIINDSKYGLRAKDGKISLNLLRSTQFPDQDADRGDHSIIYGVILDEKADLEKPLMLSSVLNRLPVLYKGVREEGALAWGNKANIVVDAIKRSIDGKAIVLRIYEGVGRATEDEIAVSFPYREVYECSMVEEERKKLDSLKFSFSPFEIKTLYFEI